MASRLATLQAELAKLDAAIDSCLTNANNFDWTVGHVKITNTAKLKELYEQRDRLWKHIQESCPVEDIEDTTHAINKFGDEFVEESQ